MIKEEIFQDWCLFYLNQDHWKILTFSFKLFYLVTLNTHHSQTLIAHVKINPNNQILLYDKSRLNICWRLKTFDEE